MSSANAAITVQPKSPDEYDLSLPSSLRTKGADAPPGLEYVASVDQLLIKQMVELLEAFTGWETRNRYVVMNSMGQQCYFVAEESTCLQRQCCGALRAFAMTVKDNQGQDVMKFHRPCSCACCCCIPCCGSCASEMVVEAPIGNVIGYIKQEGYCWRLKIGIYDEHHNRLGVISGPWCAIFCCCCPEDINYPITQDGEHIGHIAKQWAGCVRECFTRADHFSVTFPMEMDTKAKLLLFAATFQVEFLEFERQKDAAENSG